MQPATTVRVPANLAGVRLDQGLSQLLDFATRAQIQRWIKDGAVTVDGLNWRGKDRLQGGETVVIDGTVESYAGADRVWQPEAGEPLPVVHADVDIIVLDKGPGTVVHPGAGTPGGTLANRLLAAYPEVGALPRAGIVHRLDKDTTGLLVTARSERAFAALSDAIAGRRVTREYEGVVHGKLDRSGSIEAPIGRHPSIRVKMAVRQDGRAARTFYRPLSVFTDATHVRLRLDTGRTHQIRVHLQHLGYPLIGDPTYGARPRGGRAVRAELTSSVRMDERSRGIPTLDRQALHAASLAFDHPVTGEALRFDSPLPDDFRRLLAALEST